MFHDPAKCKLGRKPVRHDVRTLRMAAYAPPAMPIIPATKSWGQNINDWNAFLNNSIGDCTIAAVGHVIMLDTDEHGKMVTVTDSDILTAYEAVSGYKPDDPSTDAGADELTVLKYWRSTGVGGHKIQAFVSIDPHNMQMLREAIFLFGGAYMGLNMPINAQDQGVWKVSGDGEGDSAPGSWGGHCLPLIGYDTVNFAGVTWGAIKWMTTSWLQTYADEAYALISTDWVPPAGVAPNSFNLAQLQADLAAVTKDPSP